MSSKRWFVAGVSFVAACALCAGVALSFAPPKASRPVEWEPSPVSDVGLSDFDYETNDEFSEAFSQAVSAHTYVDERGELEQLGDDGDGFVYRGELCVGYGDDVDASDLKGYVEALGGVWLKDDGYADGREHHSAFVRFSDAASLSDLSDEMSAIRDYGHDVVVMPHHGMTTTATEAQAKSWYSYYNFSEDFAGRAPHGGYYHPWDEANGVSLPGWTNGDHRDCDADGDIRREITVSTFTQDPEWALKMAGFDSARSKVRVDHNTVVGVIDSAFMPTHEDLAGNVVSTYDFVNGGPIAADNYKNFTSSHGTECAGIVSAVCGNGIGIDGASGGAGLMLLESGYLDEDSGKSVLSDAALHDALVYASELPDPPEVLSMSFCANLYDDVRWSMSGKGRPIEDFERFYGSTVEEYYRDGIEMWSWYVDPCLGRNIVPVAAAGNDYCVGCTVPAACDGTIAVAAHDACRHYISYSTIGDYVDIAAPSDPILTCRADIEGDLALYDDDYVDKMVRDNAFTIYLGEYVVPDDVPAAYRKYVVHGYFDVLGNFVEDDSETMFDYDGTVCGYPPIDWPWTVFGHNEDLDTFVEMDRAEQQAVFDGVRSNGNAYRLYEPAFDGTSAATPFVAAAAAVLRAAHPGLSYSEVEKVLKDNAAHDLSREVESFSLDYNRFDDPGFSFLVRPLVSSSEISGMLSAPDSSLWGAGRLSLAGDAPFSASVDAKRGFAQGYLIKKVDSQLDVPYQGDASVEGTTFSFGMYDGHLLPSEIASGSEIPLWRLSDWRDDGLPVDADGLLQFSDADIAGWEFKVNGKNTLPPDKTIVVYEDWYTVGEGYLPNPNFYVYWTTTAEDGSLSLVYKGSFVW